MEGRMNVIVIMSDSFRRDNLTCYNPKAVPFTPHLDKFAAESYVFERAYCASFPTVPNRFDLFTGTHCFVKQDWSPLPFQEIVLSQILGEVGFRSALIADTPHILQHGFNYERGFTNYVWVRGQENDKYRSFPETVEYPCDPAKLRAPAVNMAPHLRNAAARRSEEDYFAPSTMREACAWLEHNHDKEDFFLWVDTFDPHEPWDPPDYYVDMYDPEYIGQKVTYPQYHPIGFLTDEELHHCRSMYFGEVTMVDRWIGRLLEQVDYLGLRENTAVVFTSDHGFLFGEHGFIGKSFIGDGYFECLRLYEDIIRLPLIVRLPDQTESVSLPGLVSSTDLLPTVLDMLDLTAEAAEGGETLVQTLQCGFVEADHWSLDIESLHGKSFIPLIRGTADTVHDMVVSSFPLTHGTPRIDKSVITTDKWSFHVCGKTADQNAEPELPPDLPYSDDPGDYHPGERKAALFDLESDPSQNDDVLADNRKTADELHEAYVLSLEKWGLSDERLELNKGYDG